MAKKKRGKQSAVTQRTPAREPSRTPRIQSGDESKEMLSEWWHDNGKYFIAGAVLGIMAIVGWKGWDYYTETQATEAAVYYEEVLDYIALEDAQDATRVLNTLHDEYAATTYAIFASFAMAKFKVEQGQLEDAAANLRWVAEHAKHAELESLAWVRLARVLLELGQSEEAYDIVLSSSFPRGIEELAAEVRGDYLIRQGEYERARDIYKKAISASVADDYNFIMMKMEETGGTSGSVGAE